MAVPITGWTFEDICMEVKGSYNPGDNSTVIFDSANPAYFNPTYNVQINGNNHLAMFRDYGSHNAPQFSSSVTVSWAQMGPSGQVQFNWSVSNLTSSSKTYYLRATIAGSTNNSSTTIAGNQGNGGMMAISFGSAPTGQTWKFYIREGNNNFTEDDVQHTGIL